MFCRSSKAITLFLWVAIFATACNEKVASCADRTQSVKETWDKAPAGAKKDAALIHFQNSGTAALAKDEKGCIAALDATLASLK